GSCVLTPSSCHRAGSIWSLRTQWSVKPLASFSIVAYSLISWLSVHLLRFLKTASHTLQTCPGKAQQPPRPARAEIPHLGRKSYFNYTLCCTICQMTSLLILCEREQITARHTALSLRRCALCQSRSAARRWGRSTARRRRYRSFRPKGLRHRGRSAARSGCRQSSLPQWSASLHPQSAAFCNR